MTENEAKIQYFSFLCPTYVFKHLLVEGLHKRRVLSKVDAKIYLLFGENFTNDLLFYIINNNNNRY